jgi:hypothetical protein
MLTPVKFFKECKEDNSTGYDILAIFPENKERDGNVECYAHIGQHSTASQGYYKTLPEATKVEYNDLKTELEGLGYKLKVLK